MAGLIGSLLLTALAATGEAKEAPLSSATVVRFASLDEARDMLTADDDFTANLSRFDLQCRLKTDKEVTLADWKRFVAQQVLPWDEPETEIVRQSLERLQTRLANYRLPLPPVIRLIRTTGEEEAEAAYTRGAAIVLPTKVLKYQSSQLDRLLAHELFHLLSRQDGAVRARLYRIIGFELCEPIELPASLAPRRITNPDAPLVNCTIELTSASGKTLICAPVLYAQAKQYDSAAGKSLFQSLIFRLLVVERRGGRFEPVLLRGEPIVIDPHKEPAFLDKIGKNTNYIIHPDEILADNFVRLVMGDKDVPTPRILDEMRRLLAKP